MSPSIPAAASVEQLRKQAKDLLREHRAGDPIAAQRVTEHGPPQGGPLRLTGAQLVIAREHGFPSWPRLRAYAVRVAAGGGALQHAYHEDAGYYEGRAEGLLASAQDATPGALEPFELAGAPLTPGGARLVLARAHGFASWAALRRHIATLNDAGEPFARAYRAVEARDPEALRELLDRFPELVAATGTNANDLLGMACATGHLPLPVLLLERGADPGHANAHGWTPLHQAAYSNQLDVAQVLLAAGARVDTSARGDGGTPLIVALFWGNTRTAELLARHAITPGNLRAAAGLGRVDLIAELVPRRGAPTAGARAHRGFYRPHSGFPAWVPSDDPQEVLDEALCWAARSDRAEALTALAGRGADPDGEVYRGTALAWAAANGAVVAITRLVALGADVDRRTSFGGPQHGDGVTALHLAAQGGRIAAIAVLLDAGADPTLRDSLYKGRPADWAEHGCQPEAAKLLRGHGG